MKWFIRVYGSGSGSVRHPGFDKTFAYHCNYINALVKVDESAKS